MSDAIDINAAHAEGPVSVVVTRRIKTGCESAYEEMLKSVQDRLRRYDGYEGTHVLRPSAPNDHEYRIIFRFDSAEHLHAWEKSAERREWLAQISGLLEGPPIYQALTGLETWFTLPGSGPVIPPPRYKMMIVTWLAVFPLLTAFNYVFQPLVQGVPLWLRVMMATTVIVPLMTYIVMPRMTRLFKAWLYPAGAG